MSTCVPWLTKDGCKGLGGTAVGYWGRDINRRITADNTTGKELASLREEVSLAGVRVEVWIGATSGNTCSCYKKSHASSDRKCRSCHGVFDGYVPGYFKWGYKTLWMAPTDGDVILSNLEITTDFKSSKVQIVSGETEGSLESGDKPFTRDAIGSVWDYEAVTYERISQYSSVDVYYSTDSGSTWSPISNLPTDNPSTGLIRFKAVLHRDTINVLSPFFEIVRARYSEIPLGNLDADGQYQTGPFIKVIKTVPEKTIVKSEYGDYPEINGLSFWTVGLSFFDSRIEVGSDQEKLEGPNVVIEFMDGTFKGSRFILTAWSGSDPRGFTVMTQTFKVRAEDSVGPFSLVW
jgi:hypothetical protein